MINYTIGIDYRGFRIQGLGFKFLDVPGQYSEEKVTKNLKPMVKPLTPKTSREVCFSTDHKETYIVLSLSVIEMAVQYGRQSIHWC